MDIFILSQKELEVENVFTTNELLEAVETRNLNAANEIEITVPVEVQSKANEGDLLGFYDSSLSGRYYRIYRIVTKAIDNSVATFKGIDEANYELEMNYPLPEMRFKNASISTVINSVLKADGDATLDFQLRSFDSSLPLFTGTFCNQSRLSALDQIQKNIGCEFDMYFEIANNAVTYKYLIVKKRLGTETGKRFEYGSNALKVTKESDFSEVYYRAIGLGKGEEVGEGFGRRIDFSEISSTNPKKPSGQRYVELQNMPREAYPFPTKIVVFEDITDPNVLLTETYKWLEENSRPKVQLSADLVDVGSLNLGDTVNIIRGDIKLTYQTRVFKVLTNLINPEQKKYELGDNLSQTPTQALNDTISSNPTISLNDVSGGNANFLTLTCSTAKQYTKVSGDGYRILDDAESPVIEITYDSSKKRASISKGTYGLAVTNNVAKTEYSDDKVIIGKDDLNSNETSIATGTLFAKRIQSYNDGGNVGIQIDDQLHCTETMTGTYGEFSGTVTAKKFVTQATVFSEGMEQEVEIDLLEEIIKLKNEIEELKKGAAN